MSNQFNYELDERQIRILMQNAESEYDESAWQKFQSATVNEQRQSIPISLPKLNFGISRSVIVPIFFVLMIGGLSSLLFSFVDFKKKEEIVLEVPYAKPVVKKTIPKPIPIVSKSTAVVALKTDTSASLKTATVVPATAISEPVVTTNSKDKTPVVVEPVVKPEENISSKKENKEVLVAKNENTQHSTKVKKKKRKKQITEELPTINAVKTSLSEGIKITELEIK